MKIYKRTFGYMLSMLLCINSVQANLIWTTSFGQAGSGNGQFNVPYGIRIHPITGEIWVADSSNSRLQVFNNDHSFSKVFDATGHGDTTPVDLVFDPRGKMYVGDYTTGNVQIYDESGNYLKIFNGNNKLQALGIDSTNQIYATTSVPKSVLRRYDSSGVLKDQFYNHDVRISVGITIGPDDKIYYSNGNFHSIISRNNDLSHETEIVVNTDPVKSLNSWIQGIDHGYNGQIYMADSNSQGINIMKENGTIVQYFRNSSFNQPYYIIGDKHGKFYVSDMKNNRVVVLFDPTAWVKPGTAILGILNLNQDLTLNNGYNLKVQAIDDTNSGSVVQSDGKLTITNNKTLTTNGGSSIEATSLGLDNGNIIVNQNTSLNMPVTLSGVNNSLDMGTNTLSLTGAVSGAGKLGKKGSGILSLTGANTYSGGTDIAAGTVIAGSSSSLGTGSVTMADTTTLQAGVDLPNLSNQITMHGNVTIDTNGFNVIPTQSFTTTSSYNLNKQGEGVLILGFANTPSVTNLNQGTTVINVADALGSSPITMNNKAVLQFGTVLDLTNNLALNGNNILDTQGNDITSYSQISGAGGLTKKGSGNLILAGSGSYSGGTNINEGLITITQNQALGSGALHMSNNTSLNLNNNIDVPNSINLSDNNIIRVLSNYKATLSKLVSNNTSNLIKDGSGELALTSENNHQGATHVNNGILSLISVFLGGDVTVASGAKLKGTGYLLSSLINNGVVAPGSSPGIIRVSEDYTQSPEGILEIFIKPSSNPTPGVDYSQLNVGGAANIAGSNVVVNAEDGPYAEGVKYDILTAAGGVNGVCGNYTLNISNVYYARLDYDLNNVFLELSRNYLPTHLDYNRDIITYINSLNHMSTGFIRTIHPLHDMAFKDLDASARSMSPNRNLVANYISQDTTHLIHNISNTRLDRVQNRMLSSGSSDSNNMHFNMDKMSKTLLSSPTKSNLINQITSNLDHNLLGSDRHAVWFTPFGQFMNVDTNSKNYGYDAKIGGMVVGYDYKINESSIAGLSFGYYQSKFNHMNNQGSNNKIKSTFVNLYGSKLIGSGYINGSLIGSVNKNHLNREIHIGNNFYKTKSKHNSHVISPKVEFGYNIKEDIGCQITPFVATEYTMEFNKGYNETGDSPLNMRIKSGRNDLLTSELGVKLRKAIKLENQEELAIKAKLSYVNKQRSKNRNKIKAGFVDQATDYQSRNYTVQHQISPGLGIELTKENGVELNLTYSGEINKSHNNHEVMFRVGKEF